MSVQMHLVHTRIGMTFASCTRGIGARRWPSPGPNMPARMRARFMATTDGGVTRVSQAGPALEFSPRLLARRSCTCIRWSREGEWGSSQGSRPHGPARHHSLTPARPQTRGDRLAFDVVSPSLTRPRLSWPSHPLQRRQGGSPGYFSGGKRRDAGARQVRRRRPVCAVGGRCDDRIRRSRAMQRLDKILRIARFWRWAGAWARPGPRRSVMQRRCRHCRQCLSSGRPCLDH